MHMPIFYFSFDTSFTVFDFSSNGSMYMWSAIALSVMMVAGFELTKTTMDKFTLLESDANVSMTFSSLSTATRPVCNRWF